MSAQVCGLAGSFVLWVLAAAIGAAGFLEAGGFYAALRRPDWAPQGWVLAPVRTTLDALVACLAWCVWQKRES